MHRHLTAVLFFFALGFSAAFGQDTADRNLNARIRLAGVTGGYAVLEDLETKAQKVYSAGDVMNGYVIVAVGRDKVEFKHKDNDKDAFVLSLTGSTDTVRPGPAVTKPYAITGTVRDATGKPVFYAFLYTPETRTAEKCARSDENGHFTIHLEKEVPYVLADVRGAWVLKNGPFRADAAVDFDLSRETLFLMEGVVKNAAGAPAESAPVYARLTKPNEIITACANREGVFRLQSNVEIETVTVKVDGAEIVRKGPWSKDAVVPFDAAHDDSLLLKGTLYDDSGKPASSVQVTALDDRGRELAYATSGAAGGYELRSVAKVAALRAVVGNVYCVKKGPWEKSAGVDFGPDYKDLFTLDGIITDEQGDVLPGASVTAYDANNRKMAVAFSGKKGDYRLKSNASVAHLIFQPGGVKKTGPWAADATLHFNLGKEGLFTLQGAVTDAEGRPLALQTVSAYGGEAGAPRQFLTSAATDEGGHYQLRVGKPVAHLVVEIADLQIAGKDTVGVEMWVRKEGPWTKSAIVDVRLADERFFTLSGAVVNERGEPVAGAYLSAYDRDHQKLAGTYTDARGQYKLKSPRAVMTVLARLDAFSLAQKGPWQADAGLDFAVAPDALFELTGAVKDALGKTVPNATLTAYDDAGFEVGRASSDETGNYRLIAARAVATLAVYADNKVARRSGPWKTSAVLDVALEEK